jgi:hypothetical protein
MCGSNWRTLRVNPSQRTDAEDTRVINYYTIIVLTQPALLSAVTGVTPGEDAQYGNRREVDIAGASCLCKRSRPSEQPMSERSNSRSTVPEHSLGGKKRT